MNALSSRPRGVRARVARYVLGLALAASSAAAQLRPGTPPLVGGIALAGSRWHYAVDAGGASECFRAPEAAHAAGRRMADTGGRVRVAAVGAAYCSMWSDAEGRTVGRCAHSPRACALLDASRAIGDTWEGFGFARCVRVGVRSPAEDLPEVPFRNSVIAALRAVAPEVPTCPGAPRQSVTVRIVFGADGSVRAATVTSPEAAAPEYARCVEAAVGRARVPAFRGGTFSVAYPFGTVRR